MKSSVRIFIVHACVTLAAFGYPAIAAGSSGVGESVAAQRDGKIIVAGSAQAAGVEQFALVRYNSDGSLDTTLKGSGKLTTAVGTGDCHGEGVALQEDGKIVVVGYSFNASSLSSTSGQLCSTVLRYTADGSLDTNFADSGKVTTCIGAKYASAESVTMQSDGKIVVAGKSLNDFAVVRYNVNGTLDTSFNETGKAIADFGADDYGRSVAMRRDGRIVVVGYTTKSMTVTSAGFDRPPGSKKECALACFKANGSLDTSFNGTGKVITNFGGDGNAEGRSVAVQTDGKIVVVGYATAGSTEKFALARYNADGTMDTSFGGTGRVMTAVGITGSIATGVALQKDGKIVAAGYDVNSSGRGYDFACLRYNTDGGLDQSFGDHGKVTTAVGQGNGKGNAVAVQSDGKITVAGSASAGDNSEFAVVRYDASGELDMSFNAAGSVLTAIGSKPSESEDTRPRASMAEINNPDGYTNVRDYDGKVIAKVKKDERFIAAGPWSGNRSDDPKWNVRLKSGITGLMDRSRIHLLPDEPLMKLNYDASKKEWRKWRSRDAELKHFFSMAEFMDDEAAEGHFPQAWELFHVVGDKTFAEFLRRQPLGDQVGARGIVISAGSEEEFANWGDVNYLQRYFPETTKIFFRGEIVDWTSPDGRYSIRKTFTDPVHLTKSKVSHAELIEKATGQVLCDLTGDDIGAGGDREGSVLWSPDSKRFAYVASDNTTLGGISPGPPVPPQRTQTTVYQSSGNSFAKVNLPLDQPPGKENDPEIKGAVMGQESLSPVRWTNANTLILERHDYYEKLLTPSSGDIHTFGHFYEITVSFKDDGTANTSWKLRND